MNLSPIMTGKKMNAALTGILSALCAAGCLAHTRLDPSRVIEFKISKSGLTRISIENDGIEDVYAYPAEPDLITHHKSGHVFVTPDDLEIPVYVTVITRRGAAQDLRLIPVPKKVEPILLRFEEPGVASSTSASLSSLSPGDAATDLLGQLIKGKIPDGFMAVSAHEVIRGEGPVEAVLEQAYQNDKFRALVFSIKSESAERQTLDPRAFWGKGDLASAFDRSALDPHSTARLFVIQHR